MYHLRKGHLNQAAGTDICFAPPGNPKGLEASILIVDCLHRPPYKLQPHLHCNHQHQ